MINRSSFRRTVLLAGAGALFATMSIPASAKDVESRPTKRDDRAAAAAPAGEKKYCLTDTYTGSRMPKKSCKTREQWFSAGVDIDAK